MERAYSSVVAMQSAAKYLTAADSLTFVTSRPLPERRYTITSLKNYTGTVGYVYYAGTGFLTLSSTGPVAIRKTILIADPGDPRVTMQGMLPITLEPAGSRVIAYSYDLEELAIGDDEGAAIADMKAMLVDSYFLLKREQHALGPLQRQHWNFLQQLIREVP
jgi:hypothetical protein